MSGKSWNEVEAGTIAKSWNKLLSVPDSAQDKTISDSSVLGKNTLIDNSSIPPAEKNEWLTVMMVTLGIMN